MKATSCKDDEISAALWGKLDAFQVILLDKFSEILANDFLLNIKFILANIRNFQEHACDHEYTIIHLRIDMQMHGDIILLIFDLLINRLLLLLSSTSSLSKAFLELRTLANLDKNLIAFFKEPKSESRKSCLKYGSIEVNLVANLLLVNQAWNSGFHQQVLRFIEPIVNGMMEALEKKGFHFHS